MPYIYSTLTADQDYTGWTKGGGDVPVVARTVRVNGGANVINRNLITPHGAVTEVSEDDVEFLKANPIFQIHQKNGHVKIDAKERAIEKAVGDMEKRGHDAPDTAADMVDIPPDRAGGVTGLKENIRARR